MESKQCPFKRTPNGVDPLIEVITYKDIYMSVLLAKPREVSC